MALRNHFNTIMGVCGVILLWLEESKVGVAIVLIGIILNESLMNLLKDKTQTTKESKR